MNYHLHTQQIKAGDGFICLPGGEPYIEEALSKNVSEVLKLSRTQLAIFANNLFKNPSHQLTVIGVTGTNGKTTVTSLVHQALIQNGYKSAIQGTLTSSLTTPESFHTLQNMARHLKEGGTHYVMEVSSHAIDQGRIFGIDFDVRLLTNITQDHLDYHKTFEAYKATKLRFLDSHVPNSIYPHQFEEIPLYFQTPLLGTFNLKNMQAAIAILRQCGLCDPDIATALSQAKAPPGRFESIQCGQLFSVIVDYAHTPDGLENCLREARKLAKSHRLLLMFGCGGNRDVTKRPLMAKMAEKYADRILVTSDNPRHEDPDQIIKDILAGFSQKAHVTVCSQRQKAIYQIIDLASPNDVVILAGKGHETTQTIGDTTYPFDDRYEAKAALAMRGFL